MSVGLGPGWTAEAAGDFAVDDAVAQGLLRSIVSGRHIRTLQEHQQMGAVVAIALMEPLAVGVLGYCLSKASSCCSIWAN